MRTNNFLSMTPLHGFRFMADARTKSEYMFWLSVMALFGSAMIYTAFNIVAEYKDSPKRTTYEVQYGAYTINAPIVFHVFLGHLSTCENYKNRTKNGENYWLPSALKSSGMGAIHPDNYDDTMLIEYIAAFMTYSDKWKWYADCVDAGELRAQLNEVNIDQLLLWRTFQIALINRMKVMLMYAVDTLDHDQNTNTTRTQLPLVITFLNSDRLIQFSTVSPITMKPPTLQHPMPTSLEFLFDKSLHNTTLSKSKTPPQTVGLMIGDEIISYEEVASPGNENIWIRVSFITEIHRLSRQYQSPANDEYSSMGAHNLGSYGKMKCYEECVMKMYMNGEVSCLDLHQMQMFAKVPADVNLCRWAGWNASIENDLLTAECVKCADDNITKWQYWRSPSRESVPQEIVDEYGTFCIPNSEFSNLTDNSVIGHAQVQYQIRFETRSYMVIREEPRITVINLMAELGGIFGVYFGASFISFIHVVVFAIGSMRTKRKKKKTSRANKMNSIDEEQICVDLKPENN